jgi:hypothetical protein
MITELADAIREARRFAEHKADESISLDLSDKLRDRGEVMAIDAAIAIITDILLGEGYVPKGSVRIPDGLRLHYLKDDLE